MKRLLCILLCTLCAVSFAACGNDGKISVTFDGNGGETESGKTSVTLQIDPKGDFVAPVFGREDYVFVGWGTAKEGEVMELSSITEACTVYAQWVSEAEYGTDIVFDSDGGTACEPMRFLNGYPIPALPVPESVPADEYEFRGWFYNGVQLVEGEIWHAPPGRPEITVVARWRSLWTDNY